MKRLGAGILVVSNGVDSDVRKNADFVVELGLHIPDDARLAAYAIWGQLLGVYAGLKKGLNPDSPKNLSRVVVLAEQS
jgi:glucosamine--fructose-6-phosphate aminotransferase (isomerizing)